MKKDITHGYYYHIKQKIKVGMVFAILILKYLSSQTPATV